MKAFTLKGEFRHNIWERERYDPRKGEGGYVNSSTFDLYLICCSTSI